MSSRANLTYAKGLKTENKISQEETAAKTMILSDAACMQLHMKGMPLNIE
jgi:hypothetical protein